MIHVFSWYSGSVLGAYRKALTREWKVGIRREGSDLKFVNSSFQRRQVIRILEAEQDMGEGFQSLKALER